MGLDSLPRTASVIQRGMNQALHIGAQISVSLNGRIIADTAVGEARAGVPMTADTIMLWLSSGKPLTAIAIAQLWERGRLELDDPVARHIPEFAAHGKDRITIRHVLTHTGGFRRCANNWSLRPWEQIIARICASAPEHGWVPGRKAGYHVASGWYILAEIVRRVDGRSIDRYLREEVLLPLGMRQTWMGMPAAAYEAAAARIGVMHDTSGPQPRPHGHWDTPLHAGLVRPGANVRGPARELRCFYEMLLRHGRPPDSAQARVLSPQTVEAITARHRTGMLDHSFNHVMDWGLGVLVNSAIYGADTVPYGFGRHASPRAFGHGGSQSSVGFADPEQGLAVAIIFNGMSGEEQHNHRIRCTLTALYEDLGLA